MRSHPRIRGGRRGVLRLGLAGAVALLVAGCGSGSDPAATTSASASAGGQEITVLAAASLKTTFTELAETFEQAHQGASVRLSFAGSSDLVAQLQQGAPGDVLATADTPTMQDAVDDHLLAGSPAIFATNTMTIAVPPGNPAHIDSFADLAEPGVKVVVCAPQVPCGAATERVEATTGVTLKPVSEEGSVTDVLGKVTAGEADAGIVYVTDVKGRSDVDSVAIPAADNTTNEYPIGALAGARQPTLGQEFVDLVLGEQGQRVLADAGFGPP